jgi:hypothetical protein
MLLRPALRFPLCFSFAPFCLRLCLCIWRNWTHPGCRGDPPLLVGCKSARWEAGRATVRPLTAQHIAEDSSPSPRTGERASRAVTQAVRTILRIQPCLAHLFAAHNGAVEATSSWEDGGRAGLILIVAHAPREGKLSLGKLAHKCKPLPIARLVRGKVCHRLLFSSLCRIDDGVDEVASCEGVYRAAEIVAQREGQCNDFFANNP